jgi:hypothetical protein
MNNEKVTPTPTTEHYNNISVIGTIGGITFLRDESDYRPDSGYIDPVNTASLFDGEITAMKLGTFLAENLGVTIHAYADIPTTKGIEGTLYAESNSTGEIVSYRFVLRK